MSAKNHAKVLIAGGSIAGLTLANILEQLGIDYLVLEKYGIIAPDLGASIGILPYGLRIFDQIGCYEDVKALVGDVDCGNFVSQRDDNGQIVMALNNTSETFNKRIGYSTIFVDRQMIIQVLYNNLRDKSKILTSKDVREIVLSTGSVEVMTAAGERFHGDVLVGADGIHSSVRQKMWQLADKDCPGYFPASDRSIPTEYCCIFGISSPSEKFAVPACQNVFGEDHSYLIITGPNHRIYWFLFKRLPKTIYGDIPRYTEEQKDALAAEHASDRIIDTVTFGELYALRTTSTLQALPEVVFKTWHYKRIMTIGDAAHKFNPISGHGGNSAIEDAAILADQLHALYSNKAKSHTSEDFAKAFEETQSLRFNRANGMLKLSHNQQSLQAMDGFASKFKAKYLVPLFPATQILEMICGFSRGGTHIKSLPLRVRPHTEPWDDERETSFVHWTRVGYVVSATIAALMVFSVQTQRLSVASIPKMLLSLQPKV